MINKHDKPIFSKNTFVEVINLIKKQDEIHEKIEKSLEPILDGMFLFVGSQEYHKALMKLLKEGMHDDGNWIEWWLYELNDLNDKVVIVGDEKAKIILDTPEKLYDFLSNNCHVVCNAEETLFNEAVVCVNETFKHKFILKSEEGLTASEAEQLAADLTLSERFVFIEPDYSDLDYKFVRKATKEDLETLRIFDITEKAAE